MAGVVPPPHAQGGHWWVADAVSHSEDTCPTLLFLSGIGSTNAEACRVCCLLCWRRRLSRDARHHWLEVAPAAAAPCRWPASPNNNTCRQRAPLLLCAGRRLAARLCSDRRGGSV